MANESTESETRSRRGGPTPRQSPGRPVAALALLMGMGCATATENAAKDRAQHAVSPELAALAIGITVASTTSPIQIQPDPMPLLTGLLAAAGYRVVANPAQADILLAVSLHAVQEESLLSVLNVTVNGQQTGHPSYRVDASLTATAKADSVVLDQVTHSFSTSDGTIAPPDLDPLERTLRSNGKLEGYVQRLALQRHEASQRAETEEKAAAERRKREEEDAKLAEEQRKAAELAKASADDDQAWQNSDSSGCQTAVQSSSCDRVRGYVAKFSSGRHVADAQQALRTAEPLLSKIADEDDWKATDLERCRKPETSSDCERVQGYLTKHSDGAHASEATRLMKSASPRLASLLKTEAAQAKAEEARQLREQRAKEKAEAEAPRRELRERYLDAKKVLAQKGGGDFAKRGEVAFRAYVAAKNEGLRLEAKFRAECPDLERDEQCATNGRRQWYLATIERSGARQGAAHAQIEAVGISAIYARLGSEFNDFYVVGLECFDPDASGEAACK